MANPRTYDFISDLHIGGDEALGVCDFEDELIGYLEELSSRADEEIELVIVGDAFGLWELTTVDGPEKLDAIIAQFPRIFEAFRRVGENIRITLLPGNHDYELACYPEYVATLKACNIHLEQTPWITRQIGQKRLWIDHGSQYDPANAVSDYGNPHAQPIGYFITRDVVGVAAQRSRLGRYNWLKDIQSVYPTEAIPNWILSNYFYREMSPLLRWMALPFLLLFSISVVVVFGAAMEFAGLSDTNVFLNNRLFRSLGFLGTLLQLVLIVNGVILGVLVVLAVPGWFILRDVRKTANRFGLVLDPTRLTGQKEDAYLAAARQVFDANPDVAAFIYGHTHAPSVRRIDGRAVINTGTWIKKFHPVPVRFGILPRIYVPGYCLSSFRIRESGGEIVIEYREVRKRPARELTLLQRMLLSRRTGPNADHVPERTVLEGRCEAVQEGRPPR